MVSSRTYSTLVLAPAQSGWLSCGPRTRARSLSEFQTSFSGRDELRGVLVRAALATGVCLPRLWRHTRRVVEEPGAHLRMPRLRSPDVDNGRDGDARSKLPLTVWFWAANSRSFLRRAGPGPLLRRPYPSQATEWHAQELSSTWPGERELDPFRPPVNPSR